jgi:hypothetical protein
VDEYEVITTFLNLSHYLSNLIRTTTGFMLGTGLLRIDSIHTCEPVTYMFRAHMIYVTCVPVYMRGVDRSQHCLHMFFVVPRALRVAVRTHDCLVVYYVCACHVVTRATRGVEHTQDYWVMCY